MQPAPLQPPRWEGMLGEGGRARAGSVDEEVGPAGAAVRGAAVTWGAGGPEVGRVGRSPLDEGDDVVDVGRGAVAAGALDLADMAVPVEDLEA